MNFPRLQRTSYALVLFGSLCPLAAPAWAQRDAASLYKSNCAVCHGADGGAVSRHDLRSPDVQKQTDAQLIQIIANGKNAAMPAYKGKLSDDQIKQLVGYVRGLAKSE